MASGEPLHRLKSFERGELLNVQDVDTLVSCWIVHVYSKQHSTFSKITLAFVAASICGFSEAHLRICPNFPWFRTCGIFLARTDDNLCNCPTCLHNLGNSDFVRGFFSAIVPNSSLAEVRMGLLIEPTHMEDECEEQENEKEDERDCGKHRVESRRGIRSNAHQTNDDMTRCAQDTSSQCHVRH